VHYLPPPAALVDAPALAIAGPQAGFVVSRAVGGSVDRHRVVRRLRHLVRCRLDVLPAGGRLVVRALAPARDADSEVLGRDLDAALARVLDAGSAAVPAAEPSSAERGRGRGRRVARRTAEAGGAGGADAGGADAATEPRAREAGRARSASAEAER
jgi:RNase P protein component